MHCHCDMTELFPLLSAISFQFIHNWHIVLFNGMTVKQYYAILYVRSTHHDSIITVIKHVYLKSMRLALPIANSNNKVLL